MEWWGLQPPSVGEHFPSIYIYNIQQVARLVKLSNRKTDNPQLGCSPCLDCVILNYAISDPNKFPRPRTAARSQGRQWLRRLHQLQPVTLGVTFQMPNRSKVPLCARQVDHFPPRGHPFHTRRINDRQNLSSTRPRSAGMNDRQMLSTIHRPGSACPVNVCKKYANNGKRPCFNTNNYHSYLFQMFQSTARIWAF